MTQEALKLALEALTYIYTETTADEDELIDQAITAIKEALAQTQEQKPQIAFNPEIIGYVAPKRTWVGLTDDEVELYWDWEDFQCGAGRSTIFAMVRDSEAKLKERNT